MNLVGISDLNFDDGYESGSSSDTRSVDATVYEGRIEGGRSYPSYGTHAYLLPADSPEQCRLHLKYHITNLLMGQRLHLAPIPPYPQRILDLGTGTGEWAIDFADEFPSASVLGIDIAPIQSEYVAPNCEFQIDDIELSWTFSPNSRDFIRIADPMFSIRDFPKLFQQTYKTLKPGSWVECNSDYPRAVSDNNGTPADAELQSICEFFMKALKDRGTHPDCAVRFGEWMSDAGFTNITTEIFKIPIGTWSEDRGMQYIGGQQQRNLSHLCQALWPRVLSPSGLDQTMLERVSRFFSEDIKKKQFNYFQYYVVYGQKPIVSTIKPTSFIDHHSLITTTPVIPGYGLRDEICAR